MLPSHNSEGNYTQGVVSSRLCIEAALIGFTLVLAFSHCGFCIQGLPEEKQLLWKVAQHHELKKM